MKKIVILGTCLMVAGIAGAANVQALSGEWSNQGTWSGVDYLPGATTTDGAIMANDHITIDQVTNYATNSVNITARNKSTLAINADTTVIRNMSIGAHASAGATVTQTDAKIDDMAGFLLLGTLSTSTSAYTISGDSTLDFDGLMNIGTAGLFTIDGSDVQVYAGNSITADLHDISGGLQFVFDEAGVGSIDFTGVVTVDDAATLVLDLSDLAATGPFELFSVDGTYTDMFVDANISGLDTLNMEGWEATIEQTTTGVIVNVDAVPEPATIGMLGLGALVAMAIRRRSIR